MSFLQSPIMLSKDIGPRRVPENLVLPIARWYSTPGSGLKSLEDLGADHEEDRRADDSDGRQAERITEKRSKRAALH
jgi:hypothetical protein